MKVDILATLLAQAETQDRALSADEQEMIEESDDNDAQDLWDEEGGAAAVQTFNTEAGLTQTIPDEAGYRELSQRTVAAAEAEAINVRAASLADGNRR
jgi:hypothetical protein